MRLSRLAAVLPGAKRVGPDDPEISGIEYDSRRVGSGSLFVAIEGLKTDGHRFLEQAFQRGAAAAVVSEVSQELEGESYLLVPETRRALALLSGALADHPDRDLNLVAVTGTNGKTTTAFLLSDIFEQAYGKSGLIGTLGHRLGGTLEAQERTTPEAPDIYRLLAGMKRAGCRAVAMEASSHALALQRIYGMRFAVAAFTNLSQDHLDFHGDLESYFAAKAALFQEYDIGSAVINLDDPYGRRLHRLVSAPLIAYAADENSDVHLRSLNVSVEGMDLAVDTPRGDLQFRSPLTGKFNAYNLLCALAVAEALQIPHRDVIAATGRFRGVPGRMERFDLKNRWAYVDYAHTPEALEQALKALRQWVPGPVHVLFGCGGNRDRDKRPLMGRIAGKLANRVYVTSDNPRDEKPKVITSEILSGISDKSSVVTILDRREAIWTALAELPPGGALLIAGKGHEDYQEIEGVKRPFDDREEVGKYLTEQER